jgi:predicted negative regulator of RcsB-dependent stress response
MQDFETEEQQIEALKKWWSENATSLILGLSIGAASLGGWKYYVDSQQEHRTQASELYVSIATQAQANNIGDDSIKKADQLVAEYADTPYAALSSLTLATYEFNKGNTDEAISHLQWVGKHAQEEEVKHIARLRLASIFVSQKKYEDAQAWLSSEHPVAFNSRYEELKGDVFVAKGEIEQARIAYDKAIESGSSSRWLKLKRQDLGSSELKKSSMVEPAA